MDENIRLAIALLDEAEAFGGIEELYGSRAHNDFLSIDIGFFRLTMCQTPYFSKLRGKIVMALKRGNKVHPQVR
jgi:hypothetical protein